MNARLIAYWSQLHGSYWFIPSLMTLGAVGLAFVTTALDTRLGADWIEAVPWLYANKPDGARALLSTVAGSMITVAGVTFSITISTVVYASSQLGPRLLTTFMQDRGNQITLGTFIATFLYCLLVLRTVRSSDEGGFVPHLALLVGLALALASLGVLIYFIHHTPASMHVSNLTARIGRDLNDHLDRLFPEQLGEAAPPEEEPPLPPAFFEEALRIRAREDGYIQALDADVLLAAATEHDVVLRAEFRPGDYVTRGQALVLAAPAGRLSDEACQRLHAAFAFGPQRTGTQDVLFRVNELVEIAARALSPGVNDPFTAIGCMDWLASAIGQLGTRAIPAAGRRDAEGRLRVVAYPVTFAVFVGAVCDQLRPYVRHDRNAALHFVKMLAEAAGGLADDGRRAVLLRHGRRLLDDCRAVSMPPQDLDELEARVQILAHLAQPGVDTEALAVRHRWLGGSA
ncbi:MAG: DUF2254 domain-containing protein [Rhodothermales bacterium]|nr:DUF2254 domain-containing protein [Rhodothermales bacterium]